MKTISIIAVIASMLLLGSTLLCGFWIKSHGADAESIKFHGMIATTTVVVSALTMILQLFARRAA